MRTTASLFKSLFVMAAAVVFALSAGCSVYARSTVVQSDVPEAEDFHADEFVGTPIIGDYDDNRDLDFVLEVRDGERVFKINVHEDAGKGNEELVEKIRQRINSMEDQGSLRVIGYYNPEYKGQNKEYGFLDLKCIVFFDEDSGQEEAYFTDSQDSNFYTQGDVTVIYAPGHHYRDIYYPRYSSPWWDTDGDGIPNRYDPWPLTYDLWYDYNLNYIPDWYDPFYIGYYPYWDYWSADFWIGYRWYTPRSWWYPGCTSGGYYSDYRAYSRLYDSRLRQNAGRAEFRMDPKTERMWRSGFEQDRSRRRIADSPPSTASRFRGYESRPVDNRILVEPNPSQRGMVSDGDQVIVSSGDIDNRSREPFNRNPAAEATPAEPVSRERTVRRASPSGKQKAPESSSGTVGTEPSRDRANTSDGAYTRSRSGGDDRTYTPSSSSRSRSVSESGSAAGTQERAYRGTSRSRSSSAAPADNSAVRSSSRERSSANPSPSSANRRSSSGTRERPTSSGSSSSGSSTRSRSSSGSSPAPAARSSGGGSRSSGSAPAARSSGGSRSRDSGSSGSSGNSSGGGDRRRR
ncbi:MAG TPA: hypothetical protein VJ417_15990 [Candidatus Glassbacteria bacterium]|nr:hypothetical protein [Candidatus Glassbacteria bacterium]